MSLRMMKTYYMTNSHNLVKFEVLALHCTLVHVDIDDLVEYVSSNSASYSPFPTAVQALLFMLINSSRPIVSVYMYR